METKATNGKCALRRALWAGIAALMILPACTTSVGTVDDDASAADAGTNPGSDAQTPLSDAVVPRDADPGAWVTILTPTEGDETQNPVTFQFTAGPSVSWVTFDSEGWPLNDELLPADQSTFPYTFDGVNFERTVRITGYGEDQQTPIATDEVQFTVVAEVETLYFPLEQPPGLHMSLWATAGSGSTFGASRDSGNRLHAGCDIYWMTSASGGYACSYLSLNAGLPIYAIADGVIIDYSGFYQSTNELVVDHGDYTVRYGEVDPYGLPNGLAEGSSVTAGQHIADMGTLIGDSCSKSMLHLEVYSNDTTGSLTDYNNTTNYWNVTPGPYMRRPDLMNCVPFLQALLP